MNKGGSNMKRNGLILSILFLAIISTVASNAQAQNAVRVDAKIPFEFSFGNRTYAPGSYSLHISDSGAGSALVVLSDQAGNTLQRVLSRANNVTFEDSSKLIFDTSATAKAITNVTFRNVNYVLPGANSTVPSYTKNRHESREKRKTRTT